MSFDLARFDPRKIKNALEHAVQPVRLFQDDIKVFYEAPAVGAGRGLRLEVRLHELRRAPYPHERVLDLMGDAGRDHADGRQPVGPPHALLKVSHAGLVPYRQDDAHGGSVLVRKNARHKPCGERWAVLERQFRLVIGV